MTTISRSALVMFSAEQMFDLVNDVESYPQFLPGCSETILLEKSDEHLVATLKINKAGVSQEFTTRNTLKYPEAMDLELVEGPFSKFHSHWEFKALSDEACKVSLEMTFEINNKLASMALGAVFKQMAGIMVDSFVKRAGEIYKKN